MVELPEVERAIVCTPQPGDTIVLEVSTKSGPGQLDHFREIIQTQFGPEIDVLVLAKDIRFAGVIQRGS